MFHHVSLFCYVLQCPMQKHKQRNHNGSTYFPSNLKVHHPRWLPENAANHLQRVGCAFPGCRHVQGPAVWPHRSRSLRRRLHWIPMPINHHPHQSSWTHTARQTQTVRSSLPPLWWGRACPAKAEHGEWTIVVLQCALTCKYFPTALHPLMSTRKRVPYQQWIFKKTKPRTTGEINDEGCPLQHPREAVKKMECPRSKMCMYGRGFFHTMPQIGKYYPQPGKRHRCSTLFVPPCCHFQPARGNCFPMQVLLHVRWPPTNVPRPPPRGKNDANRPCKGVAEDLKFVEPRMAAFSQNCQQNVTKTATIPDQGP